MLVKLVFVMQRLKNIWKIFCHDQQKWGGGTAVMRGYRAHGGPPVPPLGKTLGVMLHFDIMLQHLSEYNFM